MDINSTFKPVKIIYNLSQSFLSVRAVAELKGFTTANHFGEQWKEGGYPSMALLTWRERIMDAISG